MPTVRTRPGVVVAALTANLASKLTAVLSDFAALCARQRAVRTINSTLLPNLALLLA
jgi:hypothetical protein